MTNIRFEKHTLSRSFLSEGLAVADFNGDGRPDICTGNFYYAGPSWRRVPMVEGAKPFNRYGYSDAFLCFADDINGDGAMDAIVVGFPGQTTYWLENPGRAGTMWKKHLAVARTGNESPHYTDVDDDGRKELVFMDGGRCALAQPGDDPTEPWTIRPISNTGDPAPAHGLGIGDINGDGRNDIVIPNGWWEGPVTKTRSAWRFHPAELFGGVQMCVADFDGDGDNDVLGASAHGYGIAWTEQTADGWKAHQIDSRDSQTHACIWPTSTATGYSTLLPASVFGPTTATTRAPSSRRCSVGTSDPPRTAVRVGRSTRSTPPAVSAFTSRSSTSTATSCWISSRRIRTAYIGSSRCENRLPGSLPVARGVRFRRQIGIESRRVARRHSLRRDFPRDPRSHELQRPRLVLVQEHDLQFDQVFFLKGNHDVVHGGALVGFGMVRRQCGKAIAGYRCRVVVQRSRMIVHSGRDRRRLSTPASVTFVPVRSISSTGKP